jgi:hypothetical protein
VASTRNYDFNMDGLDANAIVPLLDLANSPDVWVHANGTVIVETSNCDWDDSGTLTAARDIERGEEITEAYGLMSQSSLDYILDTWGFLPPGGPGKVAPLSHSRCAQLRPIIDKYLGQGPCTALPVSCNLAKLAEMSCPGGDSSEL